MKGIKEHGLVFLKMMAAPRYSGWYTTPLLKILIMKDRIDKMKDDHLIVHGHPKTI